MPVRRASGATAPAPGLFLILHPARGILVLEVKEWRMDTIRDANPTSFTIDTGAGHKVVSCPLQQARQYA